MANRPVFVAVNKYPFFSTVNVNFEYFNGFSKSQKQKSIISLHKSFDKIPVFNGSKVLEVSSKSLEELGVKMSSFNLMLSQFGLVHPVELWYQSGKVFENGMQYTDLLHVSPKDAKRDKRLRESGRVVAFKLGMEQFENEPKDLFYNWLYINALAQNSLLAEQCLRYVAFTDIEFNPKKSINCQAKASAIFVGLQHSGKLGEALLSKENFKRIVYNK